MTNPLQNNTLQGIIVSFTDRNYLLLLDAHKITERRRTGSFGSGGKPCV